MGWPPCGSQTPIPPHAGWRPPGSGSYCSPSPRSSPSPPCTLLLAKGPTCPPSLDTSLGCQFLPALCPPHPVLCLPAATKEGIWYETKNKNQTRYMQYLSVCTCKSSPAVGGPLARPWGRAARGTPTVVLCPGGWPCCCLFLVFYFLISSLFFFKLHFLSLSSVEGEMWQ